jgi:hypothetical protein
MFYEVEDEEREQVSPLISSLTGGGAYDHASTSGTFAHSIPHSAVINSAAPSASAGLDRIAASLYGPDGTGNAVSTNVAALSTSIYHPKDGHSSSITIVHGPNGEQYDNGSGSVVLKPHEHEHEHEHEHSSSSASQSTLNDDNVAAAFHHDRFNKRRRGVKSIPIRPVSRFTAAMWLSIPVRAP